MRFALCVPIPYYLLRTVAFPLHFVPIATHTKRLGRYPTHAWRLLHTVANAVQLGRHLYTHLLALHTVANAVQLATLPHTRICLRSVL